MFCYQEIMKLHDLLITKHQDISDRLFDVVLYNEDTLEVHLQKIHQYAMIRHLVRQATILLLHQ